MILDDEKMRLIGIADTLKISKKRVGDTIHDVTKIWYAKAPCIVGAAPAHHRAIHCVTNQWKWSRPSNYFRVHHILRIWLQ